MKKIDYNEWDANWNVIPDFIKYHPGARHRTRLICKVLNQIREVNEIVDVGCGNGKLLFAVFKIYKKKGKNVNLTGIDFSKNVIEGNRKEKRKKKIDFFQVDIEKETLSKRFDLVLCSEVIEHLYNQRKSFTHIMSMVKPNGYALLTFPMGKIYPTERRWGHLHHPTKKEIIGFANENNGRVVTFLNWGWPSYKLLKEISNINPKWAIKSFGEKRYGFVKKTISDILYYLNFLNFNKDIKGCQAVVLIRKM